MPTRLASADTPSLTCDSLSATASNDGVLYALTAKASGSGRITGYTFDFGDHQSYSFEFSNKTDRNRNQATVTHAYPAPGVYTATARINIKQNGKPGSISSRGCSTIINTGPKMLVNTGAGNPLILFAAAFFFGFSLFQAWLRYRQVRAS